MNPDLAEEINYLSDLLAKSGFFSEDEILEILEEQFIEENVDFSQFNVSLNNFDNINFNKLKNAFKNLALDKIIAIHNCGFDIAEGVSDAFELYAHLLNNEYEVDGFCFYTFEDVEEAIFSEKLKITFGDFKNDETKALTIGKKVANVLSQEGFNLNWNESINSQIEIYEFKWDKSFDGDVYEMEGAFKVFSEAFK
ncbi:DUF6891 domain-containing protein [Methanobrevibacter oralis]|uniref:DUF6891 domain-containing protein n=1 Tax=Methanobrevibacter oralis TaxID=66851 RepID=A0A166C377_METOA|nr:hypothetical protein [Methanobrevibacter oralis]KZX10937.1 hypothetical protein MBORA_17750 [Methanobrevibacter oralis]